MDYSMKLMPQTRSEIDADGSETSTACMPNVLPSGDTTFKLLGEAAVPGSRYLTIASGALQPNGDPYPYFPLQYPVPVHSPTRILA